MQALHPAYERKGRILTPRARLVLPALLSPTPDATGRRRARRFRAGQVPGDALEADMGNQYQGQLATGGECGCGPYGGYSIQQQAARMGCSPKGKPLGFPTTAIGAGVTTTIPRRLERPFEGFRLVIPSSFAPSVSVDDIRVGGISQFPNGGNVPGEAFQENAEDLVFQLDGATTGQSIELTITNISGVGITFRAGLFGYSL